jgi:hypothetical protein
MSVRDSGNLIQGLPHAGEVIKHFKVVSRHLSQATITAAQWMRSRRSGSNVRRRN